MEVIENLKKLISNFIENRQFTKITTGVVLSVSPLKIQLTNELILDDSMSTVDAKTEYAIIDNLKETRKDKTTIITAHRLSAVVHADLILVLQNGQIIERGRHEDLLAMDGWYAQTYQSQQLEMKGEEDAE